VRNFRGFRRSWENQGRGRAAWGRAAGPTERLQCSQEADMKWLTISAAALLFAGLALQSTARADDFRSVRFSRYYATSNGVIHYRVPLGDPSPWVTRVNPGDLVSLNPQPLPPGARVALNPQPLPPRVQYRFGGFPGLIQFGR
jgi:hypothetical protein